MREHERRRALLRVLRGAASYGAWRAAAEEMDAIDGGDDWRGDDDSPLFDAELLRRHMDELEALRASEDVPGLQARVTESLYRNLPDVSAHPLYESTWTGETKRIVTDWLSECVRALLYLRDAPVPVLGEQGRYERFARASKNFGQTALMLSGGGAWGLYHLGVVKALREADLLPKVVCGSSMGAIIASGVGTRTDAELDALYGSLESIHRVAVRLLGPRGMLRERALLDPEQLREHVEENIPALTFREAYERTGRVLNVSVSPTRARQKPRVLSYRTAPDVLVTDATVASCSIPGLFPPVMLRARAPSGEIVPYVATERWVDGSMRSDLPLRRLARLHNVNHYVVSQANPFVLPFVTRRDHGLLRGLFTFGGAVIRGQATAALDEIRRRVHSDRIRPWLDSAHALAGQQYGGDIDIHPRVPIHRYAHAMANPSLSDLESYVVGGQRATWPRLPMIRDQTLIARTLDRCVGELESRVDR